MQHYLKQTLLITDYYLLMTLLITVNKNLQVE